MISEKNLEKAFIIFLLFLGVYYIYLSYGTRMLGEDEGYYFSMAKQFSQGNFNIHDFKGIPNIPASIFLSLLYSFFFSIFGASLGLAKVVSAIFGLLTLIMVYLIGKKFNIYFGIFSSLLLLSILTFTHFMLIAYSDIPIAFFSIFLVYLLLNLDTFKKSIFAGLTLGIAYFAKSSALLFVLIMILYLIFQYFSEKNKKYLKFILLTLIIFALVLMSLAIRNLYLYNYPYVEGLNLFFKAPVLEKFDATWMTEVFKTVSPVRLSLQLFSSTFGSILLFLSIFGISWLITNYKENKKETKLLFLSALTVVIFLIVFSATYYSGYIPLESRYLSIIFPQLALLGGFFLWKMKGWKSQLLIVIVPILLFSLWSSISVVQETYAMQRYPNDYIEALKWIKQNTPKDSLIFTTYSGSLSYYADRESVWSNIKGFPELMTTTNSTFIYNTLKSYNVSYILIWRSTMAQNYIIPESNLWGVFTYNFANVISKDTNHFNVTFSNDNNWIFKLN